MRMTLLSVLKTIKEARIFGVILRQRMNKFGLTISEEKSKIIEFRTMHMPDGKEI